MGLLWEAIYNVAVYLFRKSSCLCSDFCSQPVDGPRNVMSPSCGLSYEYPELLEDPNVPEDPAGSCRNLVMVEGSESKHHRVDEVQRAALLWELPPGDRCRGPFDDPPPAPSMPTASGTHMIDIQADCQYGKMLTFLERQLLKAGQLQLPSNASSEDLEAFEAEIRRGRCLFAQCKGPFDICQYYSIEHFRQGVEDICGKLAESTHEWGMHNAVVIEHRIPPDDVEADRLALHNYLVDIHSRPAAFVNCQLLQPIWGSKRIEVLDEDELLLGRKLGESSWTVACEAEWPKRSCVVAVKKPARDAPLQ
ncbi:unnamed protein product, partial [Ostreobium quekettii]